MNNPAENRKFGYFSKRFRRAATLKMEDEEKLDIITESQSENKDDEGSNKDRVN